MARPAIRLAGEVHVRIVRVHLRPGRRRSGRRNPARNCVRGYPGDVVLSRSAEPVSRTSRRTTISRRRRGAPGSRRALRSPPGRRVRRRSRSVRRRTGRSGQHRGPSKPERAPRRAVSANRQGAPEGPAAPADRVVEQIARLAGRGPAYAAATIAIAASSAAVRRRLLPASRAGGDPPRRWHAAVEFDRDSARAPPRCDSAEQRHDRASADHGRLRPRDHQVAAAAKRPRRPEHPRHEGHLRADRKQHEREVGDRSRGRVHPRPYDAGGPRAGPPPSSIAATTARAANATSAARRARVVPSSSANWRARSPGAPSAAFGSDSRWSLISTRMRRRSRPRIPTFASSDERDSR